MKTPARSGGSQEDAQAGTDCQGSTDGSCRRSRHYVVISDEFRLADFLEIPGLDLEGLVMLARIEVYEILFGQVRVHKKMKPIRRNLLNLSITSTPFCLHKSLIISPNLRRTLP